jgi:hypothetical protein
MNRRFVDLLASLNREVRMPLAPQLEAIVNDGIVVVNGCYLLAKEANAESNAKREDFPDKTGYECFINHIHIDDYVCDITNQSISYASKMLWKWREQQHDGELISIIAVTRNECTDNGEAHVRFHYSRKGESWLPDDLDGVEEAILEISSSDIVFLDLS